VDREPQSVIVVAVVLLGAHLFAFRVGGQISDEVLCADVAGTVGELGCDLEATKELTSPTWIETLGT
jgi:hypothetical protein